MFLTSQNTFRRLILGGCLASLVLLCAPLSAGAADSSVETYTNSATSDGAELPNQPLKAGELTLPRVQKEKQIQRKVTAPQLPVGSVAAPQMPSAPSLSTARSSSASYQLMMGLRASLQKAGQNPDLPAQKSDLPQASVGTAAPQPLLTSSATPAEAVATKAETAPDVQYHPGQEPRNLASVLSGAAAPKASVEEPAPKATEIVEEPHSLAQESVAPVAPLMAPAPQLQPETPKVATKTAKAAESTKTAKNVTKKKSIFGAPVDEAKSEEIPLTPVDTSEKVSPTPQLAAAEPCRENVTPWTKTCADAGYPAAYVGKITGETRVVCPGGEIKDVWLTNDCAMSPKAERAPVVEEPRAVEEAEASPVPSLDGDARVDANCGSASGFPTATVPMVNLCASGESSHVSGEGPWMWSCQGQNGGMAVSCAAPLASKAVAKKTEVAAPKKTVKMENGACGKADGVGEEVAPQSDLCAKGIAGRVNGTGPWTWACAGINGGQAAACTAPRRMSGLCGSANGTSGDSMPMKNLCAEGMASAVNGEGPWYWTCSGLYGGAPASCSVTAKVNAVCGPSSLTGHREAPVDGLCNAGEAGNVEGQGPWRWTCSGSNGGAAVICAAPMTADGTCGSASGNQFDTTPTEDLCAVGLPSRVTGSGPWNWSCAGTDNGNTASCTASKLEAPAAAAVSKVEKVATLAVASESEEAESSLSSASSATPSATLDASSPEAAIANAAAATPAPRAAKAKSEPAHVTQTLKEPVVEPIKTPAPKKAEAVCGEADGQTYAQAPRSGLCDAGKASGLNGRGPWSWTCTAKKSSDKVACSAQLRRDAACGAANGSIQVAAPASRLCDEGTATAVSGNGPWVWTCLGIGGGNSTSCSASAQQMSQVSGQCGAATTMRQTSMPETNLCDSGKASAVYGEGPWTWTCSGVNGGTASVCSTDKVVPRAPEPPPPGVDANCGAANGAAASDTPRDGLCSSGTPTSISGQGPWNWSCLGSNGGMSVSCTAPMMPPAPVNGVCGSSHGVTTGIAPRSGLCAGGISSAVSGSGPWTWSCSGVNGGGAVSCVAPRLGSNGPLPSVVTPTIRSMGSAPTYEAPTAPTSGLVTPRLSTTRAAKPSASAHVLTAPADLAADAEGVTPPASREALIATPSLAPVAAPSSGLAGGLAETAGGRMSLDQALSSVAFASGSDQLDQKAEKTIESLASVLVARGDVRVTLTAGAENSSGVSARDARRLSLNRALAIRDELVSRGVSASRVDVRALGANLQGGSMDRVDIRVNN